ncbi:CZB domain-containing protein [Rhodoferax sp. GW822-FHT02A01]|uniref:CZB domain-containing protein n=1 Tax=Rhodoferax sp. GW822-FHT02A01 TaxID=3141537 RepID=UPI00315CD92F
MAVSKGDNTMGMRFEIDAALMAHSAWKKHFRDYLNGKAAFDVTTVGDAHQCQFGKWLDDEGYRLMPERRREQICIAHDEFHHVAAEILQKIKNKRFAEARADIGADGVLSHTSIRLSELLLKARLHEPGTRDAPEPDKSVGPGDEAP